MSSHNNRLRHPMNDRAGRSIAMMPEHVPTVEELAFEAGPKCGDCLHWKKMPRPRVMLNPAAIAGMTPAQVREAQKACDLQNSGTDLSAPQVGECREHLHSLPLLQQTPQGVQLTGWIAGYPTGVEAGFRACGQFTPRLPLPVPDDF